MYSLPHAHLYCMSIRLSPGQLFIDQFLLFKSVCEIFNSLSHTVAMS